MIIAVVPAYNEEQTIGSVVRNLFEHVDHVVVVDDASEDETVLRAREEGATVICHALNRGQGAAIETGQEYARRQGADHVIHFDADGQFDARDIMGAIVYMRKTQADILFGSRFLSDTSSIPWVKRCIILPFARFFQKTFYHIDLTDAHNGFRILNQRALQCIRITYDRMAHATEIPFLAKKGGLRMVEYPVHVTYDTYGQGLRQSVDIIKDLFLGRFV